VQEVWEAGHYEWGVVATPSPSSPAMPRGKRRSVADMGPDDDDRQCNKRFRNTSRLVIQFECHGVVEGTSFFMSR
jgi:hypothetical protein